MRHLARLSLGSTLLRLLFGLRPLIRHAPILLLALFGNRVFPGMPVEFSRWAVLEGVLGALLQLQDEGVCAALFRALLGLAGVLGDAATVPSASLLQRRRFFPDGLWL